jgi:hypothetical protein
MREDNIIIQNTRHASYPRLVAYQRREARAPPVLDCPRHGVSSTETTSDRRDRNQRRRQIHDRTHAVLVRVPKHAHQQTEKGFYKDFQKQSHLALIHFPNRDSQIETEIKREKEVSELKKHVSLSIWIAVKVDS